MAAAMLEPSVKSGGQTSLSTLQSLLLLVILSISVSVSAQDNVSCPDAAPNSVYTNTGGTNYTLFCGYDWTQDIVQFSTSTFEACLLECDSFVPAEGQFACGAVSYLEDVQTCYLKPSTADGGSLGTLRPGVDSGVRGVPESVTGPKIPACPASNDTIYIDADNHNYTVQCGVDTKGNDYYNASVPQYSFLYSTNEFGSYQECFYQCGLRPGCLGFTWEGLEGAENGTGRGGCYFKQQANDCNPVIYNFYLDMAEVYNRTYVSALRQDQAQLINNTCIPCSTSGTVSLCPTTTSTAVLPPQTVSTTSTTASATPSICPVADGTLYTDDTGQRYTIYCSDGVLGDSIDLDNIASLDACLLQCSQYGSSCGSAVYASGISYCYLKPPVERGGIRNGGGDQVGVKYYDITTTSSTITTETTPAITTSPVSATQTTSSAASSSSAAPVCLVPDGSTYIDSNEQPYRFYCNAGWGGNVAVVTEITSFDACAVACDEYSDNTGSKTCGAVVWDRSVSTCYLKPASGVTVIGTGGLEAGNDNVGEKIVAGTSTSSVPVSTPFSTTATVTPVLSTTTSSQLSSSATSFTPFSTTSTVTSIPTASSSYSDVSTSVEGIPSSNSISATQSEIDTISLSSASSPGLPSSVVIPGSSTTGTSSLALPPSNTATQLSSFDSISTSLGSSISSSGQIITISPSSTIEGSLSSGTPSSSVTSSGASTSASSPGFSSTSIINTMTPVSSSTSFIAPSSSSSGPDVSFTPPVTPPVYSTPTPTSTPESSTATATTSSAPSSTTAAAACAFTGQQTFNSSTGYDYDVQCGAVISDDGPHSQFEATASDSYTQCFDFCDSAATCDAFTYSGAVAGSGPGTCLLFLRGSDDGAPPPLVFKSGGGSNVAAIRRSPTTIPPFSTTATPSSTPSAASSCAATAISTIVSSAGNTYRTQCGSQISGGTGLASITVLAGSQDCYAFCDANADCVAFAYEDPQRRCILLATGSSGGGEVLSFVGGDAAGFFAAIRVVTPPPSSGTSSTVFVTPIPSPPRTGGSSQSATRTSGRPGPGTGEVPTYVMASGPLRSGCVRKTTVMAIPL